MYLKMVLCDSDGSLDGDTSTPCKFFGDVKAVVFDIDDEYDAEYLGITFKDGSSERCYFCYRANAYLMTDDGKTIQKFRGTKVLDETDYAGNVIA